MKIQCDVCQKEEAWVFCSADEAALCNGCDHRIHHANKLASKHSRYSLLQPTTFKESPLCDICQERKALLFCQEDRAILCRECDLPIHRANEHTKKHNRFLLTGVKLSSATATATASLINTSSTVRKRISSSNSNNMDDGFLHPTFERSYGSGVDDDENNNQVGSTSSISEYLMETLPGWRVDDFLVEPPPPPNNNYHHHHLSSSTSNNGYCKTTNEATVKMECVSGSNNTRSVPSSEVVLYSKQYTQSQFVFSLNECNNRPNNSSTVRQSQSSTNSYL